MAATVTLTTTNPTAFMSVADQAIVVASTTGLTPGIRLYADKELMTVVSLGLAQGSGTRVNVIRAVDGTKATHHDTTAVIWIGRGDQFYSTDPQGHPASVVLVSPHINVLNGNIWFPEGDTDVNGTFGLTQRWWQLQTPTYGTGALGVRANTLAPTS